MNDVLHPVTETAENLEVRDETGPAFHQTRHWNDLQPLHTIAIVSMSLPTRWHSVEPPVASRRPSLGPVARGLALALPLSASACLTTANPEFTPPPEGTSTTGLDTTDTGVESLDTGTLTSVGGETDTATPVTCNDGQLNGQETDIDCGGPECSGCDDGQSCVEDGDCLSEVCDPSTSTCGPAECSEHVANMDSMPFSLQSDCQLYLQNVLVTPEGTAAQIEYDMGGTRACETGNNELALVLCEDIEYQDVTLRGVLGVIENLGDDEDWVGLVWGAQDESHFYSLAWRRGQQDPGLPFQCETPTGIIVRLIQAPSLEDLVVNDLYCEEDTVYSTLLLDPSMTTTEGWEVGESYTVTIDFTDEGSEVVVTRDGDNQQIAAFTVNDTTYSSGYFGGMMASQPGACVGPLSVSCL